MSNTKEPKPRPWKIHKKFASFTEADQVRNGLKEEGYEVRVFRMHRDETFDVKKRNPKK